MILLNSWINMLMNKRTSEQKVLLRRGRNQIASNRSSRKASQTKGFKMVSTRR